jgi:magnesium-transporting ATPase (P-type)
MAPPPNDVDVDVEAAATETTALITKNNTSKTDNDNYNNESYDKEIAESILKMFMANFKYSNDISRYPKTDPKLPPVVRFKRHRNFYIFEINQFRHWWKTSRYVLYIVCVCFIQSITNISYFIIFYNVHFIIIDC